MFCATRSLHQRVPNLEPHRFQFFAQLAVPKTQHLDALLSEKLVSPPAVNPHPTPASQMRGKKMGAKRWGPDFLAPIFLPFVG
ncbi:MAG TPA: hypothetical protein VNH84_13805 [Candidatus Saccharimonadales bacterium]|nr:hypothetical protein [Candidatus Saccharimonadales bacterium]